ncbi:MAG: transglutaminase family protein, partial [Pricia sp.]|nr:transglutaminase family protein [Pricia sp.]
GFGFKTIRVHPKKKFKQISFEGSFTLNKKEVNPYNFQPEEDFYNSYQTIQTLGFKVDFEIFLRKTHLTTLPEKQFDLYNFDKNIPLFENLLALNNWTSNNINFKPDVTTVHTTLEEIIEVRHGVCQDFAHLFCALARHNGVPARYVSGYLDQGYGYLGDSQMHAWGVAFIPQIGWVGFDPTNNLLANTDHIKVAHGKDYKDCSPLRGVIYSQGGHKTSHTVRVQGQQQQQ